MVRQRFRDWEKDLAREGKKIEWRNGSHWHEGEVTADGIHEDGLGGKYIKAKHTGRETATVSRKTHINLRLYPDNIRER